MVRLACFENAGMVQLTCFELVMLRRHDTFTNDCIVYNHSKLGYDSPARMNARAHACLEIPVK